MENFWSQCKQFFWNFLRGGGLGLFRAAAVLVSGLLVIRLVKSGVKKSSVKSRRLDNAASSFITSLVALIAYLFLALILVKSLGFSTTGIVAAFSSVMLAVALGLQDTLSSLTNGILLIFTRPFRSGDYVDIGGTAGTVKEIRLFSVKVVTPDNLTVIVPNSTVLSSVITNYSRMPLRRLDILLPVPYGVDAERVKGAVREVVAADKRIEAFPAPFFRLTEYGSSSLNFTLRVWTTTGEFWNVKFDLLEKLPDVLKREGIEIPYEQLDVHVIGGKGAGGLSSDGRKEA